MGIQGTYARTASGTMRFSSFHTLGVPTQVFGHSDTEPHILWQKILVGEKKNFTMFVGSQGKGEVVSGMGIVSGHAYSLLSAHWV